jgi:hypothetical protein
MLWLRRVNEVRTREVVVVVFLLLLLVFLL